jgi:phosphopantetheinyl transferase
VLGVANDGLLAEAEAPDARLQGGLLTAPLSLEAAFQAAGLHRMLIEHDMALPSEIGAVRWLRAPREGERLELMVHREEDRYHVDVDGPHGPVLRLRGFLLASLGPLPEGDRFPEPEGGRFPVLSARETRAGRGGSETARAQAQDAPQAWLSGAERAALSARGTPKRVADRVAGRLAAKRALHALTGVDPLTIRLDTHPSGAPVAEVPGHPGVAVSISHREGRAVAVAVSAGRVGVDLERIAPRPVSFARDWCTPAEVGRLGEDPLRLTLAWACKEAVLKALGVGLACSPREVELLAIEGDRLRVALHGEVAALAARIGLGALQIRWAREGGDELLVVVRDAA